MLLSHDTLAKKLSFNNYQDAKIPYTYQKSTRCRNTIFGVLGETKEKEKIFSREGTMKKLCH